MSWVRSNHLALKSSLQKMEPFSTKWLNITSETRTCCVLQGAVRYKDVTSSLASHWDLLSGCLEAAWVYWPHLRHMSAKGWLSHRIRNSGWWHNWPYNSPGHIISYTSSMYVWFVFKYNLTAERKHNVSHNSLISVFILLSATIAGYFLQSVYDLEINACGKMVPLTCLYYSLVGKSQLTFW